MAFVYQKTSKIRKRQVLSQDRILKLIISIESKEYIQKTQRKTGKRTQTFVRRRKIYGLHIHKKMFIFIGNGNQKHAKIPFYIDLMDKSSEF